MFLLLDLIFVFLFQHRKMLYDFYQSEGCNPLKMYLLPWCQLPLWFILSLTLRNMSGFLQAGTGTGQSYTVI